MQARQQKSWRRCTCHPRHHPRVTLSSCVNPQSKLTTVQSHRAKSYLHRSLRADETGVYIACSATCVNSDCIWGQVMLPTMPVSGLAHGLGDSADLHPMAWQVFGRFRAPWRPWPFCNSRFDHQSHGKHLSTMPHRKARKWVTNDPFASCCSELWRL